MLYARVYKRNNSGEHLCGVQKPGTCYNSTKAADQISMALNQVAILPASRASDPCLRADLSTPRACRSPGLPHGDCCTAQDFLLFKSCFTVISLAFLVALKTARTIMGQGAG